MKSDEYTWRSQMARQMICFVNERKCSGYKFLVQERWLRQFDQYCFEKNITTETLSAEIMETFSNRNQFESSFTKQVRLRLLRQLAEYLNKSGADVEIPSMPNKTLLYPRHEPYIFSKRELRDLFTQIDTWPKVPQDNSKRVTMDPVLFRMIYGCGLRIMEALRLTVEDIDLNEGILHIKNAKNGKDRLVPMAKSLVERCRAYSNSMHRFSSPGDYYFPSIHGNCYNQSSVYIRFRQYLWLAGISHSGNGPRIHDLRHVFCVHRLKNWVLNGNDLTNLLPYLSAYLGHADFRGTEYYLRLTVDLYPEIISRLELAHGYIIPERGAVDEKE